MPFRNASFDAVVCCYLLELLAQDDIRLTLREIAACCARGESFPGGDRPERQDVQPALLASAEAWFRRFGAGKSNAPFPV